MKEAKTAKRGGFTNIVGEAAQVKARAELHVHMYQIAREHRDVAEKVSSADISHMNAEIRESMVSILFSYTCLEAYINTIGIDRLAGDWNKYKGSSTEAKWKGISSALVAREQGTRHSVFNDRREPFKSFLALKKIRDDYLVHRKPEFSDIVDTKYGKTEGTVNMFNCERAGWACRVVKDMVIELNRNLKHALDESWLGR